MYDIIIRIFFTSYLLQKQTLNLNIALGTASMTVRRLQCIVTEGTTCEPS